MGTNRKEEIILTTLELAAEKGLAGVSMSMIADKIGIKKPSLYKHFSSKDEIVEAMYQFLRDKSKENANIKPVDYSILFSEKTAYEVLKGVVQGYINKEIADKLYISLTTVISHRKNITEKLGIKSISGLTIYAVMNGFIDADRI